MPRAFLSDDLITRLRAVQREEYWDTSTKGLVLRVEGQGKTWWLIYWSPSEVSKSGTAKRRRRNLGRWPVLTIAGARKEAKRLHVLIQAGIDPAREDLDGGRVVELRFEELGRRYIEERAKPRKASWRNDQWMLERVVFPLWGNRPVSSITSADVQHLGQQISRRGPVLANRALSVVRQSLRWGVLQGAIPSNPAAGVPKPGQERKRSRVLTPAEIHAVWRAAEKYPHPLAFVLMLRLLTAQRGREILKMNLHDLEPAPGGLWWNLPAPVTKARRPHRVFLVPTVVEILKSIKASPFGLVFPRSDDPRLPTADYSHVWNRVRKASETSDWDPRDLRRTAATLMSRNGVPRFVVRRVLNHADSEVTAVYDLYEYDGEVRHALLILERAVLNIVAGQTDLTNLLRSLPAGQQPGTRPEPSFELGPEPPDTALTHLDLSRKLARLEQALDRLARDSRSDFDLVPVEHPFVLKQVDEPVQTRDDRSSRVGTVQGDEAGAPRFGA